MRADHILQADLLDIIFENRNKSYGAYPLRKFYESRIYKALGIIFFSMLLFSAYNLLRERKAVLATKEFFSGPELGKVKTPDKEKEKKPVKKETRRSEGKTAFLSGRIKFIDSTQKSDPVTDPNLFTGNTKPVIPGGDTLFGPPSGPGPYSDPVPPPKPVKPIVDRNTPMTVVDKMPSFPGGLEGLKEFMKRNLHNELGYGEENVSVTARFVVGYDGILKSFEIIQDGGNTFNKEVIRVLKKMPAWEPGISNGENVSVYFTLPIKFVAPE